MDMGEFTQPTDEAEIAIARVEDQVKKAQQFAHDAQRVQHDIASIVGRAKSRDGLVSVVVTPSGAISQLVIDEKCADGSMKDLARTVISTVAAGMANAGEQALALMSEAFGENAAATARMRAELETRSTPPGLQGIIR